MDPKTEAEQRRKIADAFDALADATQPLNVGAAEAHRENAEANRRIADKLDPPQPTWEEGALARDRNGRLWHYYGGRWRSSHNSTHSTESLTRHFGPITRVLTYDPATQRVADSAKQEVVVSVDGIDPEQVNKWLKWSVRFPSEEICVRVAKAARGQLKENE